MTCKSPILEIGLRGVRYLSLCCRLPQRTVDPRSPVVSTVGAPPVFSSFHRDSHSCFFSCEPGVIRPHGIWNCFEWSVLSACYIKLSLAQSGWCRQGSRQQCDCDGPAVHAASISEALLECVIEPCTIRPSSEDDTFRVKLQSLARLSSKQNSVSARTSICYLNSS